ncbi:MULTISPECIES: glycosyltransferase [unclassified Pseudonocardia]|uniref:glycosyltransferase n=1 Tax=unclassified Pseudonocardia TaxID=2619320 RepID=UPI0005253135|nr:glycosyltransferase [Pseudonocardia sp. Ae707_Ps1]OLM20187.1 UDP-N-acetylglucosamine--N-acetylmuramyl- (pentapeptide) pyrophosphoryl-undecaprenol N-acetylglucosamine transferase [Pseudonocardia sp. Ae707_Ps1]
MTTLFLATTGGHLEQLNDLAARIPGDGRRLWVTHANEQSRSLLADRDVEFVPYVRVRNVPDVLGCVPTAHRLWRRHRVTRAISTGSGIALGYLPYLASRGVECHYVESVARVAGPSLTGRILHHVPTIRRYTQHNGWSGPRWQFAGSVFDSYDAVAPGTADRPTGRVLRVVVSLGTAAEFPFTRLVRALVPVLSPGGELARHTGRPVQVLWQTGCTPVDDPAIAPVPFLPAHELATALRSADLVICHAGAGSVLGALAAGRHPVLAVRRSRDGEAGDDHQSQLAAELAGRGVATVLAPEEITAARLAAALDRGVRRPGVPPAFGLAS